MFWNRCKLYFWSIVKLACFIAFLVQISASIYSQIAPDDPVARTVRTDIKNVEFPVAFKVCMKPSFNIAELDKVGYGFTFYFFSGWSKYEKNPTGLRKHGWAGHTREGGVFSNVIDVQNRIFQDYHSAIESTLIITNKGTMKTIPSRSYQLRKPNYPNNCLTLDIADFIPPGEEIVTLYMNFHSDQFATDIDVIIEDKLTLVDRSSLFSTRSQPINYENLKKTLAKAYLVSFKQNIFKNRDSKFCVDYPTDKYKSFNDCDNQYLEELLQKVDVSPSWANPQDLSKATNLSKSEGLGQVIPYFMGLDPGPCVEPCTQTSITSVYKFSDIVTMNGTSYPSVTLNFNPIVEVTTHAWPTFNPLNVLQVW